MYTFQKLLFFAERLDAIYCSSLGVFLIKRTKALTSRCRCLPVVRVPVLPDTPLLPGIHRFTCFYAYRLQMMIAYLCLAVVRTLCIHGHTERPPGVSAFRLTATTFPLSSVASTASWFVRMSMPLCICCLSGFIGSSRIPKGEVTNRNSSLFTGKE